MPNRELQIGRPSTAEMAAGTRIRLGAHCPAAKGPTNHADAGRVARRGRSDGDSAGGACRGRRGRRGLGADCNPADGDACRRRAWPRGNRRPRPIGCSRSCSAELATAQVRMAQVLLTADHGPDFERLVRQRFEHVADLLYMVALASAFPDYQPAADLEFEPYAESQQQRLAALVERTYEGTRDCPRMNGLRETADVLAGYRAAGRFDPGSLVFFASRRPGRRLPAADRASRASAMGIGLCRVGARGARAGAGESRRCGVPSRWRRRPTPLACCWRSTRRTSRRWRCMRRPVLRLGIGVACWCVC